MEQGLISEEIYILFASQATALSKVLYIGRSRRIENKHSLPWQIPSINHPIRFAQI